MKPRKFTFHFKGGKLTVVAIDESQAKILAQARAIEKGWDYTIHEPTMDVRDAKKYLQNVVKNWTEFCRVHPKMALAIKTLIAETR